MNYVILEAQDDLQMILNMFSNHFLNIANSTDKTLFSYIKNKLIGQISLNLYSIIEMRRQGRGMFFPCQNLYFANWPVQL